MKNITENPTKQNMIYRIIRIITIGQVIAQMACKLKTYIIISIHDVQNTMIL